MYTRRERERERESVCVCEAERRKISRKDDAAETHGLHEVVNQTDQP